MGTPSCLEKQNALKNLFDSLSSPEEKYHQVIEMGRSTPPFPKEAQCEENLVKGCQSLLYLKVETVDGILKILTSSDALISAGLAALLAQVYNGELPETVIKYPPLFLKEVGLLDALSPSRANGLKSLYQALCIESVKLIKKG